MPPDKAPLNALADRLIRAGAIASRPLRRFVANRLIRAASCRRTRLGGTVFVGVTGSAGKTTTKDLIAAVLARRYPVTSTPESLNAAHRVALAVLRTRRGGACVAEVATSEPGQIATAAACLRPTVAVVTNVMRDHLSAFRNREAIAAEKGDLVAALPPDGVAVLNADDPLVLAMRGRTTARAITFGLSPDADVRAEQITCAWPDGLEGVLVCGDERAPFRTRLIGAFWATSVLAAAAAGKAAGISLHDAAEAMAAVEPTPGRLSVVRTPGGITFIDDGWKGTCDSVAATLEVVRQAKARRRIVVFGTLSDYSGSATPRYRDAARAALDAADLVVFTTPLVQAAVREAARPVWRSAACLREPPLRRRIPARVSG